MSGAASAREQLEWAKMPLPGGSLAKPSGCRPHLFGELRFGQQAALETYAS